MAQQPDSRRFSPEGPRVVRQILPFVRQHDTHRQLIGRARPATGRRRPRLDAIIVPASRPAANIDHAVTLARAADSQLVVLCSRQADGGQVSELLAARRFDRAVVVELPDGYTNERMNFTSSGVARGEMPDFRENPNGDLSLKRNLGLLLARMAGWERIFFIDDDIRDISPVALHETVGMVGRYRSVGMRVTDFPDNSVVCHAHRETGAFQDVFISGSVLAVDCPEATSFFPDIYNEDWLFFYDDARARRLGWSGRNATRLHDDPFGQPGRAERQEFGDALAEGLYALLHLGAGPADATRDYWDHFLAARRQFLADIINRADQARPEIRDKLVSAVDTAAISLMQIQPKTCERYVRAWRGDLRDWAERLTSVRTMGSVQRAVRELGLTPTANGRPGRFIAVDTVVQRQDLPVGRVAIPQIAAADLLHGRWAKPARGRHRKEKAWSGVVGLAREIAATQVREARPGSGQPPPADRGPAPLSSPDGLGTPWPATP